MAGRSVAPAGRALVAALAGLLLASAAGLAVPTPAAAGSRPTEDRPAAARTGTGLVASEPRDQAVLAAAPAGLRLTFSARPVTADSHVVVVDEAGEDLTTGPPAPGPGNALWQPIALDPPGEFAAAYHAVLEGGGEASGMLRFSVGTGIPPDRASLPEISASDLHVHQIDALSAVLLVADGVVVLGVFFLLWRRRPTDPTA